MAVELGRQTETSYVNKPIIDTDMSTPPPIWDEIELSESYLVCTLFEEAASLASSVLKRLRDTDDGVAQHSERNDMLESAGMVLVQSLKELGRTRGIMKELSQLYTSLSAIPVQVFLAGACFQMQQDPRGAHEILEEFLSKWKFENGRYYALETNNSHVEGCENRFVLGVDTYLEVVEAYITLVTGILKRTDLAISWVEKAALPEDTRQDFLRRLHSMKDTASQASTSVLLPDGNVASSVSLKKGQRDGDAAAKQAILRYSGQHVSTFWWFKKLNIKVGSVRFAVSNGNILLTALVLLAYYYMRRKKYTITSVLKGQAQFVKKTAIDLWQLAFAYQVNPLASVESLQTSRPSR